MASLIRILRNDVTLGVAWQCPDEQHVCAVMLTYVRYYTVYPSVSIFENFHLAEGRSLQDYVPSQIETSSGMTCTEFSCISYSRTVAKGAIFFGAPTVLQFTDNPYSLHWFDGLEDVIQTWGSRLGFQVN